MDEPVVELEPLGDAEPPPDAWQRARGLEVALALLQLQGRGVAAEIHDRQDVEGDAALEEARADEVGLLDGVGARHRGRRVRCALGGVAAAALAPRDARALEDPLDGAWLGEWTDTQLLELPGDGHRADLRPVLALQAFAHREDESREIGAGAVGDVRRCARALGGPARIRRVVPRLPLEHPAFGAPQVHRHHRR